MRMLPFLLLLSACAGGPEAACRLDKLAEVPLRLVNNVPVMTVEINGKPASLVLDTGSDATLLTRVAARRLGVADDGTTRNLRGAGGATAAGVGKVDSFALGSIRQSGLRTLLSDSPAPPLDGLVGLDVMIDTELDLDVPHRQAMFYRARRCVAAAPDWPGRIVRLPVQQQAGSGHLFVPMEVDGQPLRGMLDSGASMTTLSLQSAEDAGLDRRRLAELPSGRGQAVNAGGLAIRQTQFKQLRVGSETLEHPRLTIADLPPFTGDLLVGEDYIGTRRLWFSFLLGRVFVQAAAASGPGLTVPSVRSGPLGR